MRERTSSKIEILQNIGTIEMMEEWQDGKGGPLIRLTKLWRKRRQRMDDEIEDEV